MIPFGTMIWEGAISGELKVTPDELKRQSDAVSSSINNIKARLDDAERTVNATTSYWNGYASDSFRSVYGGYKEEITEIIARLSEHITDLKTMAGVYEQAEEAATEIIESLPSDVIV